jgi:hypothetical protein
MLWNVSQCQCGHVGSRCALFVGGTAGKCPGKDRYFWCEIKEISVGEASCKLFLFWSLERYFHTSQKGSMQPPWAKRLKGKQARREKHFSVPGEFWGCWRMSHEKMLRQHTQQGTHWSWELQIWKENRQLQPLAVALRRTKLSTLASLEGSKRCLV